MATAGSRGFASIIGRPRTPETGAGSMSSASNTRLVLDRSPTNHPLRQRKVLDQRRGREYSSAGHQSGIAVHVDDFKLVAARQICLAQRPHVGDRTGRQRRRARHEEREVVLGRAEFDERAFELLERRVDSVGRRSVIPNCHPTCRLSSTRSVLERSPMIFRIGAGSIADQRRNRDDVVGPREQRPLHQVDDLDRVATGEMLFAEAAQVGKRLQRLR